MENSKKINIIIFSGVSLLCLIFLVSSFLSTATYIGAILQALFSLFLFFVVFFIIKIDRTLFLYLLVFSLGFIYLIITPYFSPIDEGAHFDYILHIVNNQTLPTLYDQINTAVLSKVTGQFVPSNIQYEAVHPPLYYLISAILISIFKSNVILSFFVLRVVGLVSILLTLFFIIKIYKELVEQEVLRDHKELFIAIVLVIFMAPGFLTRMITLSNEQLTVLLTTIFFFTLVKSTRRENFIKKTIVLAVVSALMVLTKFTTIFILGVAVIYFVISKNWKYTIIYFFVFGLLISPWLIYNFHHYHSLTATKLHVQFVKTIVNPQNIHLDIQYIINAFTRFLGTFWNPQEIYHFMQEPYIFSTNVLNTLLILCLFYTVMHSVFLVKTNRSNILLILVISLLLNVMVLCFGTISQNVDVMLGRYLYINILPFIVIVFTCIYNVIHHNYHVRLAYVFVFLSCLLTSNYIFASAQSEANIVGKAVTINLENTITFLNFQDEKYNKLLNKKLLGDIPAIIGKAYDGSYKINLIEHNSMINLNNVKYNLNDRSFEIIGEDPHIVIAFDQPYSPSKEDILILELQELSIQDGAKGQMFWDNGNGFNEKNSIWFDITKEGTYIIPVGKINGWMDNQGLLKIRLDVENINQKSFKLKNIFISNKKDN